MLSNHVRRPSTRKCSSNKLLCGRSTVPLDCCLRIAELGLPTKELPGPRTTRYIFDYPGEFYTVVARVYRLAANLPDAPLEEFQFRTKDLPKATEVERLVVQRIGQEALPARLANYWQDRCPLTGALIPHCYLLHISFHGKIARSTPNGWTYTLACCFKHYEMQPSTGAS